MRFPRFGVLAATALVAACGSKDNGTTEPVTPTTGMSTTARAYLTEALDFEQDVFYWGDKINWTTMRADVMSKAANAQKPSDTYNAIQYSIDHYFRPLGDFHSGFWPPSEAPGRTDSPPNNPLYLVQGQMLGKVAYLYVPTFAGLNPKGRADTTLAMIKALDANKPCGWIIDLRTNPGGTWAAMFAGLNPLVGDGQFAGLVDNTNAKAYFYVQNGEAGIYDPSTRKNYPQVTASSTYTLNHPNPPVALLQGPWTASAGEIILLAFKGYPNATRSFGTNSSGDTTVPAGEYLPPDSAYLNITAAIMFDRTGKLYGNAITPDQVIPSDTTYNRSPGARDLSTTAALNWLATRPECGGTGSTQDLPALRANPDAFPQSTGPRTRPLNVSPYFLTNRAATTF
ncbi:peptidase S41 [Gemmatirosa kalamazoonensis]|uniref:Peptidase S41 n=1 Tax=Gemmatirosa kalamazoonensis TaxID=861299 RepID=W0RMN4_9BACT|nr:S41 family peptidase [Gemmatirosa kalamazoonensis]AHG91590.1 peptidase S41 [Gemmatirosa kalamazoonensis]